MQFLTIGILLNSCDDKGDPENNKIYFLYTNNTNENVELELYDNNSVNFKNIKVFPSSSSQITLKQNNGKGVGIPFLFDDGLSAEKVVIKFETSNKCLINYSKIRDSKLYDNYTESMLNNYGNIIEYLIDEEEYNIATTCD
jgi:hypothetical protein